MIVSIYDRFMTDTLKKLSLGKACIYKGFKKGMTEMTGMTGIFYFISNSYFYRVERVKNVKIKRNRKKLSFLSLLSRWVIS